MPTFTNVNDVRQYVLDSLHQFKEDPADTDYQHGYQACLEELVRILSEDC